jgi:hypothetical protein
LAQVQADELRVRVVGGVMWLASALSVTSRLWLGGVLQIRRDRALIRTLLEGVRTCGTFETLLLCTDGLASLTLSRRSRCCVSHFAVGSEGVPGSFCRTESWSPKRSSATLGDG